MRPTIKGLQREMVAKPTRVITNIRRFRTIGGPVPKNLPSLPHGPPPPLPGTAALPLNPGSGSGLPASLRTN